MRTFKPGMRVVALIRRLAVSASGASVDGKTCARICSSTTALTLNTCASRPASCPKILVVPENLPLEHAALTEPLACVVRGLEAKGQRGDSVVVIGAGTVGLMFMHMARLCGVEVIAVVVRDRQIASATFFGASHVVHTASVLDAVAAVRGLTPTRGAWMWPLGQWRLLLPGSRRWTWFVAGAR